MLLWQRPYPSLLGSQRQTDEAVVADKKFSLLLCGIVRLLRGGLLDSCVLSSRTSKNIKRKGVDLYLVVGNR